MPGKLAVPGKLGVSGKRRRRKIDAAATAIGATTKVMTAEMAAMTITAPMTAAMTKSTNVSTLGCYPPQAQSNLRFLLPSTSPGWRPTVGG